MRRGLLLSSVVAVIAVMALFSVTYASEDIMIENINEDTAAATDYKTMKSIGQGTSFVGVLYVGAQTGNTCSTISPWNAFGAGIQISAYAKFFNKVAGVADIFFIVTDNGGHVVSIKQTSVYLNSGVYASCAHFTLGPGEYFLSLLIGMADGLLLSPDSYFFVIN